MIGGVCEMEGTVMAAVGSTLFGSLLCHQRFKRRGQELTHTRAKLMLVGLNLVFCGVLVQLFG